MAPVDNKYLEFVQKNAAFLKLNAIEKTLGMPTATLTRFAKGERGLAEQWHRPLEKWVKKFVKDLQ